MLLPGFPGIATALGLFAVAWIVVWLRTKPTSSNYFEPEGAEGEFGKGLLPIYLDITKLILGIAAGSIVLLVGSSNLIQQSGGRSLKSFASPMFMVAMSIIYGVLFMTLLVIDYERHRHNPAAKSYTRFKYTRNQALGFSALSCFCVGYAWLVVDATR
jgi:hypothetical protein